MVKAVIDHCGFFIPQKLLSTPLLKKLKADLIVQVVSGFDLNQFDNKSFKVYRILKNKEITIKIKSDGKYIHKTIETDGVAIPIYYALNELKEYNLEYTVNYPEMTILPKPLENTIQLRPGAQIETYNICCNEIKKPFGGGIINLSTASGKSPLSLKIACYFNTPTLIILNKRELIEQWKKEIKKFIPNARIGLIQGKIFDVENKDFILGMLHTITMKNYITYKNFEWNTTCFLDEVHNISSEIFSNIMFKVRPKYIFGLTGTLERKDGLHSLIHWYLGDILYSNISAELKQETEIHIYKYKGDSSIPLYLRDNKTPACSTMLTNIANDIGRNELIVDILKKLTIDPNRHVLLISDRISQLRYLNSKLDNSALFIGTMKSAQLDESKKSQILLATYKLASEGFSLEKLNCLVFGTSRTNITQAIGRIYRKSHTITPIIVDIYDDFSFFKGQYYRRRKIYKDCIKDCKFKSFNGSQLVGKIDIDVKNEITNLEFLSDSE